MAGLRDLLRAKFPEAHADTIKDEAPWETHIRCLDAAGVWKGAITEVVGEMKSSGAALLMAALLENRAASQEPVALVDGGDVFDPRSVTAAVREQLLWLRCQDIAAAMKATDLLLRDGNIQLVVLDLQLCAVRKVQSLPTSTWHRLRALVEKSHAALCVLTPCHTVPCAKSRLILEPRFTLEAMQELRADLLESLAARVERTGGKNAAKGTGQHANGTPISKTGTGIGVLMKQRQHHRREPGMPGVQYLLPHSSLRESLQAAIPV